MIRSASFLLIAAFVAAPALAQDCSQKVSICHSASGKYRTLVVSSCAVAGHLSHGDYAGACENNCNLTGCNDGNACTTDTCNTSTGQCSSTAISCDDSNACTSDACSPATGCFHSAVIVDDGNACTADSCTPATGVVHTPVNVDDGNACTVDSCNPATGPVHTPVPTDDGNACTSDSCNPATGVAHTPVFCNDNDACTGDSCNPATGCVHTPINPDDGNACTTDTCSPATGPINTPLDCNDGNLCTVDSCNPSSGCSNTQVVCAPAVACNPGTGACECVPTTEVCGDGIDNDCDGRVDEGCIGDRAWNDVNRNGIQDAGEPGLAGATFLLRTSSGALVGVAVSNASGAYSFGFVPAGTYYVEVIPPFLYSLTMKDVGSDDTRDSDFDGETTTTDVFSFDGGTILHIDAGFVIVIQT